MICFSNAIDMDAIPISVLWSLECKYRASFVFKVYLSIKFVFFVCFFE